MSEFFQLASRQCNIIGALFMREIQLRWGRRNLGFAWVFAEPLVFAFPVLIMWSYLRSDFEDNLPVIPFMWSGYLPLLMFRHVCGQAIYTLRMNSALLYHRSVTPLDIMFGRCCLEVMGALTAIFSSFLVLYMIGVLQLPENPPLFLMGILYMAWWSFAVGIIIGAWSERNEMVHHIWMPVSYMYIPTSGFIYMAHWLPPSAREVALTVMPSLHAYEMIRGGLFGSRIQVYYDVGYLTFILATLTLFGLWMLRDVRRYIEFE